MFIIKFLQRISIACYAEGCTSYSKSVRLSVRHRLVSTVSCQNGSSYGADSPTTVVSARNSKGNIGSGVAE